MPLSVKILKSLYDKLKKLLKTDLRKKQNKMSNEYKDWESDKIEEERQIVAKYPFLHLRNIDGTIDTNSKFPMMCLEIPNGWHKLFFQLCKDITPILEKENKLNEFYFIQVKEKYNYLRCYYSNNAPLKVLEVIAKYEQMSQYICTVCGQPATYQTQGYIASFCTSCWKDYARQEKIDQIISFKPYFIVNSDTEGVHCDEKMISFADEWTRLFEE